MGDRCHWCVLRFTRALNPVHLQEATYNDQDISREQMRQSVMSSRRTREVQPTDKHSTFPPFAIAQFGCFSTSSHSCTLDPFARRERLVRRIVFIINSHAMCISHAVERTDKSGGLTFCPRTFPHKSTRASLIHLRSRTRSSRYAIAETSTPSLLSLLSPTMSWLTLKVGLRSRRLYPLRSSTVRPTKSARTYRSDLVMDLSAMCSCKDAPDQ